MRSRAQSAEPADEPRVHTLPLPGADRKAGSPALGASTSQPTGPSSVGDRVGPLCSAAGAVNSRVASPSTTGAIFVSAPWRATIASGEQVRHEALRLARHECEWARSLRQRGGDDDHRDPVLLAPLDGPVRRCAVERREDDGGALARELLEPSHHPGGVPPSSRVTRRVPSPGALIRRGRSSAQATPRSTSAASSRRSVGVGRRSRPTVVPHTGRGRGGSSRGPRGRAHVAADRAGLPAEGSSSQRARMGSPRDRDRRQALGDELLDLDPVAPRALDAHRPERVLEDGARARTARSA